VKSSVVCMVFVGLGLSGTVNADEGHHGPDHNQIRGVRGEFHGTVSPFSVFGVGGRAEFAVVPDGFIGGDVQDELALSLGADAFFAQLNTTYYSGGAYFVPIAALQWNFYVGDWSIFPEAGVVFYVSADGNGWNGHEPVYLGPDLGIGFRYHFASRNALLVRASSPGGLQVGLTF
jgi:hypothetical protein